MSLIIRYYTTKITLKTVTYYLILPIKLNICKYYYFFILYNLSKTLALDCLSDSVRSSILLDEEMKVSPNCVDQLKIELLERVYIQ